MAPAPKVFWDGYGLDAPYSGVFVHARSLASALLEVGLKPWTLAGTRQALDLFPDLNRLPVSRFARAKPVWPLLVGRAVNRVAAGSPHILHGLSNFNVPYLKRTPGQQLVLTVHDVIPLIAPRSVSTMQATQLRLLLGPALRAADKVICVSGWTRSTLIDRYPEIREKCVVIPNGVGPMLADGLFRTASSKNPRILMVARFEHYKRLDLLVRVLRALPAQFTATLATDAGGETWIRTIGSDLLAKGRLKVLSRVSRDELNGLYRTSEVLLHTSRFEGFCLPAVEALAAGCPVVYQAGMAMDEILGPEVGVAVAEGAAVDHWVQGVKNAVRKREASDWSQIVTAHYRELTTWKDAAQAVQSLYNSLL